MTLGELFRVLIAAREKILHTTSQTQPALRLGEEGMPTAVEELWADIWVRKFCAEPKIGRLTRRQRYVLALRFQSAIDAYRISAHFEPREPVREPAGFLERVLVADWHRLHREFWLRLSQTPRPGQDSFSA